MVQSILEITWGWSFLFGLLFKPGPCSQSESVTDRGDTTDLQSLREVEEKQEQRIYWRTKQVHCVNYQKQWTNGEVYLILNNMGDLDSQVPDNWIFLNLGLIFAYTHQHFITLIQGIWELNHVENHQSCVGIHWIKQRWTTLNER